MVFTIEPMITMGSIAAGDLVRRLDGGHRRRLAHRAVRAHRAGHRHRRRRPHALTISAAPPRTPRCVSLDAAVPRVAPPTRRAPGRDESRARVGVGRRAASTSAVDPTVDVVGARRSAPRRPATSRNAGMSAHTTAVPCAIASSTGIPKPSCRLGNTNRSAPAKSGRDRCAPIAPGRAAARGRRERAAPRRVVVGLPARRTGEHEPVRHAVGRRAARTRRAAPCTFLRGWNVPTQNTYGRSSSPIRSRARRRSTSSVVARVEVDAVGHDADALAGDRGVRRDLVGAELRHRDHQAGARFAAAAKPAPVERTAAPGERLGHRERCGVVHGDDERHRAGRGHRR